MVLLTMNDFLLPMPIDRFSFSATFTTKLVFRLNIGVHTYPKSH